MYNTMPSSIIFPLLNIFINKLGNMTKFSHISHNTIATFRTFISALACCMRCLLSIEYSEFKQNMCIFLKILKFCVYVYAVPTYYSFLLLSILSRRTRKPSDFFLWRELQTQTRYSVYTLSRKLKTLPSPCPDLQKSNFCVTFIEFIFLTTIH